MKSLSRCCRLCFASQLPRPKPTRWPAQMHSQSRHATRKRANAPHSRSPLLSFSASKQAAAAASAASARPLQFCEWAFKTLSQQIRVCILSLVCKIQQTIGTGLQHNKCPCFGLNPFYFIHKPFHVYFLLQQPSYHSITNPINCINKAERQILTSPQTSRDTLVAV